MTTNYSSTSSRPQSNGAHKAPLPPTKILLLGLRRAGKTSIQQVLFNNLAPNQTFYLESTMRITKVSVNTVIPLEIWDCPGNITAETLGVPLSEFSTIIFVIDIRDLYNQPISKLVDFIVASYEQNPDIILEVFVHKAEKLQDDDKIENFRQIHERVSDRLLDMSPEYEQMQLNFHLTSVYDHSLHEAMSRVLHKLIDALPFLEELLNVFCANSQSPKAFLFDTRSRLYVATDASPVDSVTHNLCCDYLLMLNAFGPLYKTISERPAREPPHTSAPTTATTSPLSSARTHSVSSSHIPSLKSPVLEKNASSDLVAQYHKNGRNNNPFEAPHGPTPDSEPKQTGQGDGKAPGALHLPSPDSSSTLISSSASNSRERDRSQSKPPSGGGGGRTSPRAGSSASRSGSANGRELFYPSACTALATPSSPSGGTTTLAYYLITKHLALLALIPTALYEERRGLLEYNVVFFRQGVQEICNLEEESVVSG